MLAFFRVTILRHQTEHMDYSLDTDRLDLRSIGVVHIAFFISIFLAIPKILYLRPTPVALSHRMPFTSIFRINAILLHT